MLLGHTLDDQSESVLLGLARGSGAGSLQGMAPVRTDSDGTTWIRPLLACAARRRERRARPRVWCRGTIRTTSIPATCGCGCGSACSRCSRRELGPGIAEALARTADQLREDAEAFDEMIHETIEDIVEHAEAGISVSVAALAANPAALRNRIIRLVVQSEFGVGLTRTQTVEVARLVTDWSGQGPIDLPGCTAARQSGRIVFAARE